MKNGTRIFWIALSCAGLLVPVNRSRAQTTDDLIFIHHSVGEDWLNNGLRDALLAKGYIDEVNEITYGTTVTAMAGRPDSLGPVQGDLTDMCHWILWFNDYLQAVRTHGCDNGVNRIIMFKSCYPNSDIYSTGTEPGDPFAFNQDMVEYMALYRHPGGAGTTYTHYGYSYSPLENIFAANPDILFVPVTAPSRIPSETCNDWADRCRVFNNWLKNTWLPGYNAAHPNHHNVAIFDLFDALAYPNDHTGTEYYTPMNGDPASTYPVRNMTRSQYRTEDSHPNQLAGQDATVLFATATSNLIDSAYAAWGGVSTAARPRWFLYD